MKRYGATDVLFAVLADKRGCWGWIDLWRTAQESPFTADEVGYVAAVTREVMPALRRSIARQFVMEVPVGRDPVGHAAVRAGASAIGGGPRPELPQQAVLTPDADMAVVGGTASVEEWLRLLQAGPLPSNAYRPRFSTSLPSCWRVRRAWIDILRPPVCT